MEQNDIKKNVRKEVGLPDPKFIEEMNKLGSHKMSSERKGDGSID